MYKFSQTGVISWLCPLLEFIVSVCVRLLVKQNSKSEASFLKSTVVALN